MLGIWRIHEDPKFRNAISSTRQLFLLWSVKVRYLGTLLQCMIRRSVSACKAGSWPLQRWKKYKNDLN